MEPGRYHSGGRERVGTIGCSRYSRDCRNLRYRYLAEGRNISPTTKKPIFAMQLYSKFVLLPSMKCIRALFSVCMYFVCEVVVGVGASAERDHSAPVQTAPCLSDGTPAFLLWNQEEKARFAFARLIVKYGYSSTIAR